MKDKPEVVISEGSNLFIKPLKNAFSENCSKYILTTEITTSGYGLKLQTFLFKVDDDGYISSSSADENVNKGGTKIQLVS